MIYTTCYLNNWWNHIINVSVGLAVKQDSRAVFQKALPTAGPLLSARWRLPPNITQHTTHNTATTQWKLFWSLSEWPRRTFFKVVVVLEPILNKWASENKSRDMPGSKERRHSLENLKTLFFKAQEAFVFIFYFLLYISITRHLKGSGRSWKNEDNFL